MRLAERQLFDASAEGEVRIFATTLAATVTVIMMTNSINLFFY